MIRRVIIYLYTGDYEPACSINTKFLRGVHQSRASVEHASVYHQRFFNTTFSFNKPAAYKANSECACIANAVLGESANQPFGVRPSNIPREVSAIDRAANTVQVMNPLTIHATMYSLGDKYEVERLCERAKEKFQSCLYDHWNSEDFIEAVQIVYSTTPDTNRGLRDVVVESFQTYFNVDLKQMPGAEEKLATIDDLSFLLMKSWGSRGSTKGTNGFGSS